MLQLELLATCSYRAFTETRATQTMKTNQMVDLAEFKSSQSNVWYKTMKSQLVHCDINAYMTMVSVNALSRALDLNLVCDLVDVIALNVAI